MNITQDYQRHVIYHAHLMSLLSLIPSFLLLLAQGPTPEQKAVGYVLDAVPRWPTENHCFSCHNNGDGARALFVAYRMKYAVSGAALKSTSEWLQKPNEWGKSGTLGFGDEKLATIQFGAALVDAMDAGIVVDKSLMARAAAQLLPHQEADGSWQVDAQASAPSAVTYGPVLATFMARRTLERAADNRLADAIARSDGWLRAADLAGAVNAAAVVLAFENRMDVASRARLDAALSSLLSIQNSDGGWGAFARTPSEPFESAMALLALNTVRERAGIEARIVKGREFLISVQSEDGGWSAARQSTTGETYARHISTTAWATQALLATKR